MKPFLSFQGSRACFFSDLFTGDTCPLRIPFDRPFDFTQGHEQRRMAQGCGFPHTQVAKRTAPSDSAAFDKLRPRASRGELVAGRQSLKKRFHRIRLFQLGTFCGVRVIIGCCHGDCVEIVDLSSWTCQEDGGVGWKHLVMLLRGL
jgi:hypothetical protein